MGDIMVLIAKLISTFQLHIYNSKHYKPCKFSEMTSFNLLRVKFKNLHFRINLRAISSYEFRLMYTRVFDFH